MKNPIIVKLFQAFRRPSDVEVSQSRFFWLPLLTEIFSWWVLTIAVVLHWKLLGMASFALLILISPFFGYWARGQRFEILYFGTVIGTIIGVLVFEFGRWYSYQPLTGSDINFYFIWLLIEGVLLFIGGRLFKIVQKIRPHGPPSPIPVQIIDGGNPNMKKCPFCAEQIQTDAILCRYCHSTLKAE